MTYGTTVTVEELIRLHERAAQLSLKPGAAARALRAGGYMSRFRGRGMEFDEARNYQPGDDVRTIDWRVTARTGSPHTKLFREERERPVLLIVDQSTSMRFGTRVAFKSVIAARAAALLAWAAADNGDRVGTLVFTDDAHHELRPLPGKRGVLSLIKTLAQMSATPSPPQQHATPPWVNALQRAQRITRPGTFLIILSDFRNPSADAERYLGLLRRHNDILPILIFDPLEQTLPPPAHYAVSNGARHHVIDATQATLRNTYAAYFQAHHENLQRLCRSQGLTLAQLATTDDPPVALRRALASRPSTAIASPAGLTT